MIKTYSELIKLKTFDERFKYCMAGQYVGEETFGGHRYLNQKFYKSPEWRRIRQQIIIRDNACDLALEAYPIFGSVYIHHLNSMKIQDLLDRKDYVYLPEFLVCVSFDTHQALHYGKEPPNKEYKPRTQNDTAPWLMEV